MQIDFKGQSYLLDTDKGKWELAKDVAGLANLSGGVLVVGVRTEKTEGNFREIAAKLRPVSVATLNREQYHNVIRDQVRPAVDFEVEYFPDPDHVGKGFNLPILTNAPVREMLKFREDNRASFERFRSALRQAIREQIERGDSDSPEAIASAVVAEYIKPELAEIELQLAGIKRSLSRKINAHIAVGGAAVGVGVIGSTPLLIAATAAAATASVAQIINKNVDGKQAVEMSDLYFLWKARTTIGRH